MFTNVFKQNKKSETPEGYDVKIVLKKNEGVYEYDLQNLCDEVSACYKEKVKFVRIGDTRVVKNLGETIKVLLNQEAFDHFFSDDVKDLTFEELANRILSDFCGVFEQAQISVLYEINKAGFFPRIEIHCDSPETKSVVFSPAALMLIWNYAPQHNSTESTDKLAPILSMKIVLMDKVNVGRSRKDARAMNPGTFRPLDFIEVNPEDTGLSRFLFTVEMNFVKKEYVLTQTPNLISNIVQFGDGPFSVQQVMMDAAPQPLGVFSVDMKHLYDIYLIINPNR